jgi:hypothetical protein
LQRRLDLLRLDFLRQRFVLRDLPPIGLLTAFVDAVKSAACAAIVGAHGLYDVKSSVICVLLSFEEIARLREINSFHISRKLLVLIFCVASL